MRLLLSAVCLLTAACSRPEPPRFLISVEQVDAANHHDVVVVVKPTSDAATEWMECQIRTKADWSSHLTVCLVADADAPASAPMLGSYKVQEESLHFIPTVPLAPESMYRITFDCRQPKAAALVTHHRTPGIDSAKTLPKVSQILPKIDVVPANHLKFYIHFSHEMTQGSIFDSIELVDEEDGVIHGAFREVELWNHDGDVLTVWLHPGRQKTGVNLNENEGPVLKEGHRYVLRVLPSCTSTYGLALLEPAELRFSAGPPDHTCPDPKKWRMNASTLELDEALDAGMLGNPGVLWLTRKEWGELNIRALSRGSPDGRKLSFFKPWNGRIPDPAVGTTDYLFIQEPLAAGHYTLHVRTDLEDLAGNTIVRPFERDLEATSQPAPEVIHVPFEVK